jgi:hypothetical protein
MPYITEVPSLYLQRFYTGWISLRNQLITPIRVMGRRVIELYDALIAGNDFEITPYLSLKRRAGHTLYVNTNFPAQFLYSWKTNTAGTYPIIDTTGDVEYVVGNGTIVLASKAANVLQSSILGIGDTLYVSQAGGGGLQFKGLANVGTSNWGIANTSSSSGPTTCTTAVNAGSGTSWANPANAEGAIAFATVTLGTFSSSKQLKCGAFGFSVSSAISGVQVTANIANPGPTGFSQVTVSLFNTTGGFFGSKFLGYIPNATAVTLGGPSDLWGNVSIPFAKVNTGFFVIISASTRSAIVTFQVNDVTATIFTGGGITATPTGSGSFSAVNGFCYSAAYGNSTSGEISNGTPVGPSTGPFSSKAYVGVPVVASTDAQVDQIHVYRTTDEAGGNQLFELPTSPYANTTATIQDTATDLTLQVTSQAELNLGNTPPAAGLTNLNWFSGRMWGSLGNTLFASTGPETLAGTAPQSNWNPGFQWVIPGVIIRNVTGPNGMLVLTQDECYIVRGTDITNYTVNLFVKDFGIRTYNAVDTDGTNLYVFTSDRQFICISSSGATDMGLPIADQLLNVDPTQCYVSVNRYGLDSIVRILDTVNGVTYDYNLNQQCWNLPGILQMPNVTAMGSIETSPGVWRLVMSSTNSVLSSLAVRDINNFDDLGATYSPRAVFGSIQLADPGSLAKFGGRGGLTLEYTNAGKVPTLSVLPNDMGCTMSLSVGAQITGQFTPLINPVPDPPTYGAQPKGYRSLRYYWSSGKALSAFVRHLQFQIVAASENTATELIGFGIFGDQKSEAEQAGPIPQIQGR